MPKAPTVNLRNEMTYVARVLMTGFLLASMLACTGGHRPEPGRGANLTQASVVYDAHLVLDLEAGALGARWRLEYLADERTGDSVSFFLSDGLVIETLGGDAVRGYRVEPYEMIPVWNRVTVDLDGSAAPGDRVTLHLAYSGTPRMPPSDGNAISPEWVELNVESMWHPLFATTDREMTGTLRVALPAEWEIVSVGPSTFHGGVHLIRNSTPLIDVPFVASPSFQRVESEGFTAYHQGADHRHITVVLESAEACAAHLNARYGVRRALPHGRIVLTDRVQTRYARGNYMVLDRFADPENRERIEGQICHELAHYWTAVGNFLGPDHWMSEAFAEYATALYIRERFGRESFDRRVQGWRDRGAGKGPVWTPDASERPGPDAMYILAPYLLARLEDRIGEERFARLIRAYMVEDVRTTRHLLERLRLIAGEEAEREFREELGSGGSDLLPARPR
jgi:hypothetical protein